LARVLVEGEKLACHLANAMPSRPDSSSSVECSSSSSSSSSSSACSSLSELRSVVCVEGLACGDGLPRGELALSWNDNSSAVTPVLLFAIGLRGLDLFECREDRGLDPLPTRGLETLMRGLAGAEWWLASARSVVLGAGALLVSRGVEHTAVGAVPASVRGVSSKPRCGELPEFAAAA